PTRTVKKSTATSLQRPALGRCRGFAPWRRATLDGRLPGELPLSVERFVSKTLTLILLSGAGVLEGFGRFFSFLALTAAWCVRRPFDGAEWLRQMARVGVASLPVVILTGAFTGMVMTLQIFQGFARFRAEGFVGTV